MTIIIETGAGLPDAESYASVAAADARCASLGLTAWAALAEPAKEVALRKATIHLGSYRTRWAGRRATQAQALDWPRYNVVVDDFQVLSTVVPGEIVNACIDLAARAGAGEDLAPDLKRTVKEKVIGPIKTVYADGAPEHVRFRAVDLLLAPYLCGSGTSGRLVRG